MSWADMNASLSIESEELLFEYGRIHSNVFDILETLVAGTSGYVNILSFHRPEL